MKLAVIGGGSTYTPELADGIGRLLPQVEELVLVDPDPGRMPVHGHDPGRDGAHGGEPVSIRIHQDQLSQAGEQPADAVGEFRRVGGSAADDRELHENALTWSALAWAT